MVRLQTDEKLFLVHTPSILFEKWAVAALPWLIEFRKQAIELCGYIFYPDIVVKYS
jgi:hypothetical protein